MSRRALLLIAMLVAGEVGVFFVENRDVVEMNRTTAALAADDRFPDIARSVLARGRTSRWAIERVAEVAHERGDRALHVAALERIVADAPQDAEAWLRLAEALREAGRLDEAERIYRTALDLPSGGGE